jgi:hypothetical protein
LLKLPSRYSHLVNLQRFQTQSGDDSFMLNICRSDDRM